MSKKHTVSVLPEKSPARAPAHPAGRCRARECEGLGAAEAEVRELHLAEAVLQGLSILTELHMRVGAHALEGFDIRGVRFDLREARKKRRRAVAELLKQMVARFAAAELLSGAPPQAMISLSPKYVSPVADNAS